MAGVDNYLAMLARLRSGRVMGIGTVEAGGWRGSAFGLEGGAWVGVVGGRRAVPLIWRKDGCGFLFGAVGCALSGLGFGLEEAGGGE